MARVTYAFITRHTRLLLAILCVSAISLVVVVRRGSSAASMSSIAAHAEIDSAEVESLLARVGIEPATLAAAGVAEQSVSALVTVASQWCSEYAEELSVEDQRVAEASRTLVIVTRSLRRGEDSYTQQDLANARGALDQANAAASQRVSSFLQSVGSEIEPEALVVINRLNANRGWHLYTPYLAVDLGEESWLSLKNALRCGESAPPEDQTTLANVRSDMGYTLATTNLSSKLPGIQTAWEHSWAGQ